MITIHQLLKPLQESKKEQNEIRIDKKELGNLKYKGKIKNIPYYLLNQKIKYWSYNFHDRINIITY